ncbi:MAG: hypothetical protein ACLU4J_14320 [Butyricimonas paravirosa]
MEKNFLECRFPLIQRTKNTTLTLNALIYRTCFPEANLVVEELSGDDYTFIGENKNDDRTVSVEVL